MDLEYRGQSLLAYALSLAHILRRVRQWRVWHLPRYQPRCIELQ
jgi:hypothetical protein